MKIHWIGHSSFLIEDSFGRRLLTDPFHSSLGLEPFKGEVNIITISHEHFDHNNREDYPSTEKIISSPGFYENSYIKINGFESYHDDMKGLKRGPNTIFLFELENLRLCHLGDLGHKLDEIMISKLQDIDLLFIPVGGHLTLGGSEAGDLCRKLKSTLIVPMHYKTYKLNLPLEGPEELILSIKNVERLSKSYLSIKEKPQGPQRVILFKDWESDIK